MEVFFNFICNISISFHYLSQMIPRFEKNSAKGPFDIVRAKGKKKQILQYNMDRIIDFYNDGTRGLRN